MKIVFLDIDGVLNSRRYDRTRDFKKDDAIDESRLPLLRRIIDLSGAKIVLSSTWRTSWDKDPSRCDGSGKYVNTVFAKYGLEIFDKTPYFGVTAERKDEIKDWLEYPPEPIESFVILDDSPFGWGELSERFVKTNPIAGLGLEPEHVEKALELLRRVAAK